MLAALTAVVALAWLYLIYLAQRMGEMSQATGMVEAITPAPWSIAELVAMFIMWVIMMIGMMLPGATPMILLFARLSREHQRGGQHFPQTAAFVSGYVLAWGGFCVAATGLQAGLQSLLLSPMLISSSSLLGATLFIAAGLYQLTPLKRTCLNHCRSPLDFSVTVQRHASWILALFREYGGL